MAPSTRPLGSLVSLSVPCLLGWGTYREHQTLNLVPWMDPSHHFQLVSVSRQMCARLGWIIIGLFAFHGSLSFFFSDLYLKQAVMDGHANRRLTAGHHLFMQRTSCRERLLYTTYIPTEILSVLCTGQLRVAPHKSGVIAPILASHTHEAHTEDEEGVPSRSCPHSLVALDQSIYIASPARSISRV